MYSLKKKVEGIILSGGYSERMGYPKSLLEWDKKTLLEYQINSLITGGCDGVLGNTAIAEAKNPVLMAESMKHAVIAGRKAFKAGRMQKRKYASASSPQDNLI